MPGCKVISRRPANASDTDVVEPIDTGHQVTRREIDSAAAIGVGDYRDAGGVERVAVPTGLQTAYGGAAIPGV